MWLTERWQAAEFWGLASAEEPSTNNEPTNNASSQLYFPLNHGNKGTKAPSIAGRTGNYRLRIIPGDSLIGLSSFVFLVLQGLCDKSAKSAMHRAYTHRRKRLLPEERLHRDNLAVWADLVKHVATAEMTAVRW
ncbi:predicted protein [Histoplasma capsulatum H143]|uniref:Uncharacterized protein n=1 Tax=Ajellomyces capsulatus (strain H143) TaxID=544712 RepID=C6HNI0_AJECH|nr:predicted protein [Histoplasma capsulatum H143]